MATARLKGKSYEIRVSLKSDETGRRIRVSKMWCPPAGMTQKQIERELEKQKISFEEEMKGEGAINSDILFTELIEIWRKDHALKKLSRKTLSGYDHRLPRIKKALGHLKISAIRSAHLNRFYENLEEVGISKHNGKLSARTILDFHKLIQSILNWAVDNEYLERNRASKATPPKVEYVESMYLSEDGTKRLLSLLSDEPIQYRTMIQLLIYSGLRRGELLGLQWSDIDFESETITVKRNLQYFGNSDYYIKEPKTAAGKRIFSISKDMCSMLMEYKEWQNEIKKSAGDEWQDSNWIFTRIDGTPCLPNSLTQWFRRFIQRNDLPKVTPHSLRHTHASLLIAEGVDIATVSKRLGHSNPSITLDIYTHSLRSSDIKAVEKLDNLLAYDNQKVLEISHFSHLRGKNGGKYSKQV